VLLILTGFRIETNIPEDPVSLIFKMIIWDSIVESVDSMKQITANGLTFMTGLEGQGPRFLFISGTGADLRRANTALTSPLTKDFQILSYDQRGMGQSEKPDRPYTMQDYAEDAVAILDAYGWDDALLAGYSFGGMVAQEIAIRWPERVTRLILMATTAGGEGGSSYPLENLSGLPPEERARKAMEVSDLTFTQKWQADNPEASQMRITNKIQAQKEFAGEPNAAMGARRQLAARAGHNTYDRLNCITAPTLVLSGTHDGQAPMPAQKAMAEAIPNCQFEIMPGSHGMLWESNAVFDRISQFMKR